MQKFTLSKFVKLLAEIFLTKNSSEDPLCAIYRVGRTLEAKDAARGALKTPWWTLGCKYQVRNTDYSFHASLLITLRLFWRF